MIAYTEKGYGMHEAIRRAGHWLAQEGDQWRASDDAAVQAIIDGYTLVDASQPIIACIKQEAQRRILAFLPEWKQSNANARANELNEIRFVRAMTPDEQAELDALRALWARAKAIRDASNAHEAALVQCTTFAQIFAYDTSAGWPE